jgi:hypothetical protein
MRSLLPRAAAVLALAFGAAFATQSVAFADDHTHTVSRSPYGHSHYGWCYNGGLLGGLLGNITITVPVSDVLDLDDVAVLGVVDND